MNIVLENPGNSAPPAHELEHLRERNAELERQLGKRMAEIAALQREAEHFAYSVSHDLRAPLRHITAFAAILERTGLGKLDESERAAIQSIKEAADRMSQLINDLLRLSRAGRAEMNCAAVPLSDAVRQAQNDLSPEMMERNIVWRIASLPAVEADPTLMRQVFVCLLDNAIKFTRQRDPAVIEVGAREEPDRWIIFVRDNGAGFDQKFVNRLFGVFQRLHSEREFEGTGIGLAIAQKIISRHGGDIWAEGRLNEGAAFYFSLPKPPP